MHKDRDFDLIVFGATGFTGQLVAEYLARNRPEWLRWALAGRSLEKLAQVRSALVAAVGVEHGLPGLPLLLADSHDDTAPICVLAGDG
ncbi:MAG TPA: saccharopine dehydrogenase NADP-binding domain-containing protein, partial [Pseudomonadota bacterium]|nr:saccharopine dehydrogenase NADP-binding domain-containing protein [Pseudomonadota bacterium]